MMGSRLPERGTGPMLLVVITPISGTRSNRYCIIGVAVAIMPEGIVKGPEMDLPRNS